MGIRLYLHILFFVLGMPLCLGATIYGNVYDISLEKHSGALLEVNTTPTQFFIATDGSYSLDLPKGTYIIVAMAKENGRIVASENKTIAIMQEGRYVIDFILFPLLDDENLELDFSEVIAEDTAQLNVWKILLVIIVITGACVALWFWRKGIITEDQTQEQQKASQGLPVQQEDEYIAKMLDIINRQGGRTTQKDIRKELPLSEAKISLLIAELEHKGKIEKIKKGRGNIIILKHDNKKSDT